MSYDCSSWPVDLETATTVECPAHPDLTNEDIGPIQAELFSSSKIKIDLSENGLVGSLEDWSSATSLQELNLKGNSLTGELPSQIPGFLLTLTALDLSDNEFDGAIPSYFSQLNALQSLDISGNSFDGCVPCPPLLDCTQNNGVAGVQRNGDDIYFCTGVPSSAPSLNPTTSPSYSPTSSPSIAPSVVPSASPSATPTFVNDSLTSPPIPNAPITESPVTTIPDTEPPSSNSTAHGSHTFSTNTEFAVVSAALLGTLGFLLILCAVSAVYVRRQRFLRRIIAGRSTPVLGEPEVLISNRSRPNDGMQLHAYSREGSSANQGQGTHGSTRHNALSFDAREGWRSDIELRTSLQRNGSLFQYRG